MYQEAHNGDHPREVSIWTDGIRESNTRNIGLNVYALRFKGCKAIFPFSCSKTYENESLDNDIILQKIVHDLK
jgi:hypothetical protein